jgi:hypothetical protein
MNDDLRKADIMIGEERLRLAAQNLQHLLKIQEEQTTLNKVVAALESSLIDAHGNNPTDLCDMMVAHAHILDGLFHYYLDASKGAYTSEAKVATAMKAQAQTVRALHAWKKLKTENYIQHKIVRHVMPEEKNTQNELDKHAPLDA